MPSLSDPINLPCGVSPQNRLVKAAMAEQMASANNLPDEKYVRLYSQWAEGGWGTILTGNVQVDPVYLGSPKDLSVDKSQLQDPAYIKAWKEWANACRQNGTTAIVQICHPGRQSPALAGKRGFWDRTVAPSAIPLDFGSSFLATAIRSLMFGTPRALTAQEVGEIIDKFVLTAKHVYESGFDGVEIHAAHGYLLAQFMSEKSNIRTDEFGGTPAKRVEIVVQIINKIRAATSPTFCIGIKLNSADHQDGESMEEVIEQVKRIIDAKVDFIEISGGTYENPKMMTGPGASDVKASTARREAFFLDFAKTVRELSHSTPLIVTGGFRSRVAMQEAISSGDCDFIGIGRPAAIRPYLPRDVIFNKQVADDEAKVTLQKRKPGPAWLKKIIPVHVIGTGAESGWYAGEIRKLASVLSQKDKDI